MFKVLNALEFSTGASHAEIMDTDEGPCLIEIGARCHGGGGSWMPLARACIGYTQVFMYSNIRSEGIYVCR
jgi:hypothetical protein